VELPGVRELRDHEQAGREVRAWWSSPRRVQATGSCVCCQRYFVRIYGLTSNVWSSRDTPKLLQLSSARPIWLPTVDAIVIPQHAARDVV
jgi:hypothetical protein